MKTLQEAFCERHQCDKARFRRKLFRASLYPHARPLAMLMGEERSKFFAPDFELIDAAGSARRVRDVAIEVLEYKNDHTNRKWLRRNGRVRISGLRLQRLARQYLPG